MKNKFSKILALVLVVASVISVVSLPASAAVKEKDKAQITVTTSSSSPQKGDTITVSVQLENYATMTPKISAMELSLKFDTSIFSLVEDSIDFSTLKINNGDAINAVFNGEDSVNFYYCYANNSGDPLPRANVSKFILFKFKLKVTDELTQDTPAEFEITKCNLYDSVTTTTPGSPIALRSFKLPSVKAYVERPAILFNESGNNEGYYCNMVKVEFDTPFAQIIYEDRDPQTITSPYFVKENGKYKFTAIIDGQTVEEEFTVNRDIKSVSLRVGTYTTKYALNEDLNLAKGELIVQYYDESPYDADNGYSYIPLSDSNVSVSGYDKTAPGIQNLNVIYMGFTTSMTVTVMEVSVAGIIVKTGSELKYKYVPVGYPIDPDGISVIVQYSDGTQEEKSVDHSMLTEYLTGAVGVVNIGVKVGDKTISDAFSVEYVSADDLTTFKNDVKSTDVLSLTAADRSKVDDLKSRYNALVNKFGPAVMTYGVDVETQYNAIVARMDELAEGMDTSADDTDASEITTTPDTEAPGNTSGFNAMKIVGIVLAVIVILSVVAGAVYFIIVYVKRKKEEEAEYYDDDDDDDDDDDMAKTVISDFNYFEDDDLIGRDFEEDEDDE